MNQPYHPETYWSEVAQRIKSREERNVIAGFCFAGKCAFTSNKTTG